jgi:hypothetical protein
MMTLAEPKIKSVGGMPILYMSLSMKEAPRKRTPAFPGIVSTDANDINITAQINADKRESNSLQI